MLFQEAPEYEQNFSMVMRVLEYAEVKEEDEEYISPLDLLFQAIERENPSSVAVRQYKVFKMAAGKTSKSILVSTAVRLAPFNLPQIQAITDHDDMDLYTLGEKKAALYAVIPDNDNTFNFLVSLLYSQAFQTLYYSADQIHHGALPHHVHFVLDEFAAMPLPGFTRELATMRSRNISASTIIQNMAQIKELYKDSWKRSPVTQTPSYTWAATRPVPTSTSPRHLGKHHRHENPWSDQGEIRFLFDQFSNERPGIAHTG